MHTSHSSSKTHTAHSRPVSRPRVGGCLDFKVVVALDVRFGVSAPQMSLPAALSSPRLLAVAIHAFPSLFLSSPGRNTHASVLLFRYGCYVRHGTGGGVRRVVRRRVRPGGRFSREAQVDPGRVGRGDADVHVDAPIAAVW